MAALRLDRAPLGTLVALALLTGCGVPPLSLSKGQDDMATIGAPAAMHSKTFKYTGKPQHFVVPSGVTQVRVDVVGGAGAGGYLVNGGNGGVVKATIAVTPGETLGIYVAGVGGSGGPTGGGSGYYGGAGGFNGGGNGGGGGSGSFGPGSGAGGGGGASDVRQGGDTLKDRVIVAGGGGGAGASTAYGAGDGGAGGGKIGAPGAGDTSGSGNPDGYGGEGGSQDAGGAGGAGGSRQGYGSGERGFSGKRGAGGAGGGGSSSGGGGGGGGAGGGYYGGGGGGAGSLSTSGLGGGGGAGGGSSFVEKHATRVKNLQGAGPDGNGQIVVSWAP